MRNISLKMGGFLVIALVMALSLAFSPLAEAMQIKMTDSSNPSAPITISDGGLGFVIWAGVIGNFNLVMTTGKSKPVIGSPTLPKLELTGSANYTGSGSTLTIEISDNNFLLSSPNILNGFVTHLGGDHHDGDVTFNTYFDNGNTLFAKTTHIAGITFLGDGGGAAYAADKNSVGYPSSSPFSVTMVANITLSGASKTTQLTGSIRPTPEPGTILLLGFGLLGLGFISRKKVKIEG